MPNIFLTSKCNLNCTYCFASEFVNKDCSEISYENFMKVLQIIKNDGFDEIGLIGGEPTLYPYLKDILNVLQEEKQFSKYTLYTNGLEIDKFIENLTDRRFLLLINSNSPANLGPKYEKLCKNIQLLREKNINFVLGINIYEENMDYSYIFDLIKLCGRTELRFSISFPNDIKEKTTNILDSFRKIKPTIISFLKDCLEHEVVPYYDCCSLPDCILNDDDRRLMATLAKMGYESNFPLNPVNTCLTCQPVLDIFPDMTVGRCFGLAKHYRVPLLNFKSLSVVSMYFFNSIDVYARLVYADKKCENCRFRLYRKCGICLVYKLNKVEELKKFCIDNI